LKWRAASGTFGAWDIEKCVNFPFFHCWCQGAFPVKAMEAQSFALLDVDGPSWQNYTNEDPNLLGGFLNPLLFLICCCAFSSSFY